MKNLIFIVSFACMLFLSVGGWSQTSQEDTSPVYPPSPSTTTEKLPDTGFKLAGYGTLEFEAEEGETNFSEVKFNPIFLWKKSDRLFFKSEVEIEAKGDPDGGIEQEFNLEYADMNFKLNKYATFFAGKFLTPIGTFQERLHPDWINKSINKPIGFGKKVNGLKRLQSGSEIGVGIRGGIPLNDAKMNYVLFMSNGAVVDTTSGQLGFDNLLDNNKNKAIGGRIGLLPIPNSSLEIGVSGYVADVGPEDTRFSDLNANIFAADLTYVKLINGFGKVDIRGQYQMMKVDDAIYSDGVNDLQYTNETNAYYVQFAYQLPTLSEGPAWLNKLELVARYANLDVADRSPFGADQNRFTLGLNYWASWNAVVKAGLDFVDTGDETETEFALIFSMGF
ncbi:MAG: hypothetical protein D6714_15820 [Bacteroidetes bacterium]|nr:MAG: hypothetical protein D6714_15820 [Bacteroidota bacterium]